MKKLYFLFFILININSFAQTSVYHPFPDSNVVWNVESVAVCSSAAVFNRDWYSYIINGDTSIGGGNYHKIYIPLIIDSSDCWGNNIFPGVYLGGIRQDTAIRKVYFIEPNATQEKLLYDFTLQVGDTMHGYLISQCGDDSIITDVDSVLINGDYRKRWMIPLNPGPEFIIEGIGYVGGPFSPICSSFESSTVLSCFTQDNNLLYVDSINVIHPGLCGIINSISFPQKSTPQFFYPNPVNDEAVIETADVPSVLEIYNSTGEKILEQKIVSNKTILQLKYLQNGIYFYRQKNSSELIHSGKFIKN